MEMDFGKSLVLFAQGITRSIIQRTAHVGHFLQISLRLLLLNKTYVCEFHADEGVQRMSDNMVKKSIIHGIAICADCDWSCEDYRKVEKSASDHARKTGHRVKADLGYVVEYAYKQMLSLKEK